ncbi:MAG: response regulator [Lachnospiraceae bacterium]|nr:response regulator [Lachnospiraceae bacterium]
MTTEDKYLNSHTSIQALIDQIPNGVGIYHVYPDGNVKQIYNNEGYYKIIESSRMKRKQYEEFNVLLAVHPEEREDCKRQLIQAVKEEQQFNFEMRICKDDGSYKWIAMKADIVEKNEEYVTMYASLSDIDQLKTMQQELEQNQAEIQIATDRAGILYWIYETDKHRTVITRGKGYGYDTVIENVPEVFRGTGDVYPEDEIKYFGLFEKMQSGVEFCETDARVFNQLLKQYQWQHITFSKISENRYVGSSLDITERKRVEQKYNGEIMIRQELLQDSIISYKLNLSKKIVEEKITKYPDKGGRKAPFELTDDLWKWGTAMIVDEEDRKLFQSKFEAKALLDAWDRGETSVELSAFRMKIGDRIKWYTARVLLVQRPYSGDIIGITYTNDIDIRMNNELGTKRVLLEEMEFVALINSDTEKIRLISAREGESCIPPLEEGDFLEYRRKRIEPIVLPEDLDKIRQQYTVSGIRQELDQKGIFSLTYRGMDYANKIWRKRLRAFYLDAEHQHIILLRNDVTDIYNEELRQQEILQKALDDSREANRLKTDFLSRMSHDMRTPMNGILGLTQLSKEENDIEVMKDYLNQIELSGKVLLDLINDTLDMNKIDSGNLKLNLLPMNSEAVFSNVITNARIMAAEKGIELKLDLPDIAHGEWKPVIADASRLEQIFFNIISNAIKFTPNQGTVEIIFKNLSTDSGIVRDKYIIRDSGIGMKPEFVPHLFDAFAQENRNPYGKDQGSGLGMSIVKQLVEMMNGSIQVTSELNKGTEVTLIMQYPIYEGKMDAGDISKEDFEGLAGKHILLCEDHPLNARIATKLLEKKNIKVDVAENGKIGLDQFETLGEGYYDCILMDVRMPVMDGLEATRAIRSLDRKDAKNIPIIAMTANAFDDDVKQCMEAGMNAHMAKPIDAQKMYQILAEYMKR